MIATYLRSLNRRERALLIAGSIAVLASVIYVAILEPGYQRLNMLRKQVPTQAADLQWMRGQVRQHRGLLALREDREAPDAPPLLTVVEESATRAGLRENIERMQPGERGSVRVWFDNVPFDPWLAWLDSLRRHKVSVSAVSIDKIEPGKVNIRLTLTL